MENWKIVLTFIFLNIMCLCCADPDPDPNIILQINQVVKNAQCCPGHCCPDDTTATTDTTVTTEDPTYCEFWGILYENGEKIPDVCTTFVCENGTWSFKGFINPNCSDCYLHNDPHIYTYFGTPYDNHGRCEYALTQVGISFTPEFAVYSKFETCVPPYTTASCLDEITFVNDARSNISFINHPGFSYTFDVKFNGDSINLTSTPKFFGPDKCVAIWRDNFKPIKDNRDKVKDTVTVSDSDCVIVMGSQGIMIQYCGWDMHVWAHHSLTGSLYGLCGYLNNDESKQFTGSDGVIYPNIVNRRNNEFSETWETDPLNCPPNRRKRQATEDNCDAVNSTIFDEYREVCADNFKDLDIKESERDTTIENCAFDRCIIISSNSTEISPEDWLKQAKGSAARSIAIQKSTADVTVCSNGNFFKLHDNGQCFTFISKSGSWDTHLEECLNIGGSHLLEITEEEYPRINEFVKQTLDGQETWIGGRRNEDRTSFKWPSGTDVSESWGWANGEPNDYGGNEDCMHTKLSGLFNDRSCGASFDYSLCEM